MVFALSTTIANVLQGLMVNQNGLDQTALKELAQKILRGWDPLLMPTTCTLGLNVLIRALAIVRPVYARASLDMMVSLVRELLALPTAMAVDIAFLRRFLLLRLVVSILSHGTQRRTLVAYVTLDIAALHVSSKSVPLEWTLLMGMVMSLAAIALDVAFAITVRVCAHASLVSSVPHANIKQT